MSDAPRPTTTQAAALRQEFPADQVGKLPKGGTTLDYVGHAAVRLRLLDVDPVWNWEPVASDDRRLPAFDLDGSGNPIGLWIRLTVCGVTRLGYGSCPGKQFDAEKVLIGDAIRNAAMSFGVATYLWVKGHDEDPQDGPRERAPRPRPADVRVDNTFNVRRDRVKDALVALPAEQRAAVLAWAKEQDLPAMNALTEEAEATFISHIASLAAVGEPGTEPFL